jgi:MFS family permease
LDSLRVASLLTEQLSFKPREMSIDTTLPKIPEDPLMEPTARLDQIFDYMGIGEYQIYLLIILSIGCAFNSMQIVLFYFIQECLTGQSISTLEETILTALVFIGQFVGYALSGPLGDTFGRYKIIIFGWILTSGLGLLSAISPDYVAVVITRFLVGIGVGSSQGASFDYLLEFLPSANRSLVFYLYFADGLGIFLLVILCEYMLYEGWRFISIIIAIPILLLFMFAPFFMMESPRWLASQRRFKEAEKNINEIYTYNMNTPIDDKMYISLKKEYKDSHLKVEVNCCNYNALVSDQPYPLRNRTLLLWTIWYVLYLNDV